MDERYETEGSLYIIPNLANKTGLIGMEEHDYTELLARDLMDKEVRVTVTKAHTGAEYNHGQIPSHVVRGGLYTIEMEKVVAKPQIDLSPEYLQELLARGFRDLDRVKLVIERLPYDVHREANYDNFKLDVDIEPPKYGN